MICIHRIADTCSLMSSMVNQDIPTTEATCKACKATDMPMSLNVVTASVAYYYKPSASLLTTVKELHYTRFNKPGTCLRKIFKELVISENENCGCDEYASRMDLWGTQGCIDRIEEIIYYLNSQNSSWFDMIKVVCGGYLSTRSLVETAISHSK